MAIGQLFWSWNQSSGDLLVSLMTFALQQVVGNMNLITLGERRIRGDLIETFKLVTGKVKNGQDIFKPVDLDIISSVKLMIVLQRNM